jgi:hypothetical protein
LPVAKVIGPMPLSEVTASGAGDEHPAAVAVTASSATIAASLAPGDLIDLAPAGPSLQRVIHFG